MTAFGADIEQEGDVVYTDDASHCEDCGGTMTWCGSCEMWSRNCCVDYGTCECY